MGAPTSNRNKRDASCHSAPFGSGFNLLHIAKKLKFFHYIAPMKTSKSSVSKLSRYPQKVPPIDREIQAPCTFARGFNSKPKKFTTNSSEFITRKPLFTSDIENALFSKYNRAKESATNSCKRIRFKEENDVIELSDSDKEETVKDGKADSRSSSVIEMVEDDRGLVDISMETKQIAEKYRELDQNGQSTSSEMVSELTNGKMLKTLSLNHGSDVIDVDLGVPLHKKLHHESTEKHEFSLRRLKFDIKLLETKRAQQQQTHAAKKKEDVAHEPFRPLTEEEEDMVANALSYSNRNKVLVTHENSNITITGVVLQCLRPHAWLNDEVINVYLELLKERENREPKKFLKCHFFNTFFYKKLISGKTGYDYNSVRRWTTQKKLGYGLHECDKIFVPIHKEIHWCLAVINKREEKFQYLDSLGGADKKVLRMLAKYITDEVKDKTGKNIDVTSWEHEFVTDLPNQENGYDCGMFMIKYADFYSRDIGLCFNQEHMPYFRLRTAKEILKLRAN